MPLSGMEGTSFNLTGCQRKSLPSHLNPAPAYPAASQTNNLQSRLYYIMEHSSIRPRNLFYLIAFLYAASCTERTNSDAGRSLQAEKHDTATTPADVPAGPDPVPGNVEDIQQAYGRIMAQMENGSLDSTSFKYSCHGEKNGTVSYFSEKGRLRMIVHRYNEYDHHSAEDRYFVTDSTLFFVYLNRVSWAFESGAEGATKDNITEHRVYLVGQKPIRCLEKKFVVRSQAANNPRSETVASKEVDCTSLKSVTDPYRLLTKYRNEAPAGCLED